MSPRLKAVLIYSAKNAVNAALLAAPAPVLWPHSFSYTQFAGLTHMLWLMGYAAIVREAVVWFPVILKWSQTDNNPPSVS